MEYYYTAKANISEDKLLIKGDEEKHLTKVLRKEPGDEIYVTDGERNLFRTKIERIGRQGIECTVLEKQYNVNEPGTRVGLFPSLLKKPDRFEYVIEKATELGVYEIFPLISENVINKSTDRHERWQSIALAAMKQSQRCYLPEVKNSLSFDEALRIASNYETKFIAHERGKRQLSQLGNLPKGSVSIFIGPEGGFSEVEIGKALNTGFKLLNLGSRKLRSETAAIVILGLIFMSE